MNTWTRPKYRSAVNAALLIGSFALGQGAIFLVQTLLVANDKLDLLANFGIHFSFAMLALMIVDWGSLTTLSRRAASCALPTEVWPLYWNTTVARMTVAAFTLAGCAYYAANTPGFGRSYVIFGSPALLVWALNFAGLLDGLKLSGVSGLTGALPYITSALALFIAGKYPSLDPGRVTGIGLSLGYALTVFLQYFALAHAKLAPGLAKCNLQGVRLAFTQGASTVISTLPGQFFFRAQIVLCNWYFGAQMTALMLYARQVSAACSQLVGFLRRVEFPNLVQSLRAMPNLVIRQTFETQRLGTYAAIVATILLMLGATTITIGLDKTNFSSAATVLLLFGPGVLTGALYLTFVQTFYALGRFAETAIVAIIAASVATTLSFVLPRFLGIGGFALAEVLLHLSGLGLLTYRLRGKA